MLIRTMKTELRNDILQSYVIMYEDVLDQIKYINECMNSELASLHLKLIHTI